MRYELESVQRYLFEGSNLGGHAVAGVQNSFVIVLSTLVQAVATSFAVSHL